MAANILINSTGTFCELHAAQIPALAEKLHDARKELSERVIETLHNVYNIAKSS